MQRFILRSVGFLTVLAVASCFELFLSEFEPLALEVNKYKCIEEGRFPHPDGCGGYVECVKRKEGNFKRSFGSCHGNVFSSDLKHCMPSSKQDNECKKTSRSPRALAADEWIASICSELGNGFVCTDCKTAVNCVEGVAYPERCGAGNTCAMKMEFGGAVCYPDVQETCNCEGSGPQEFHPDIYNFQAFYFCDDDAHDPDFYHCPGDLEFDPEQNKCSHPLGLPECTETGLFADNNNCSLYYACILNQNGWDQKVFECNDYGLMYNERSGVCEDPCNWDTGEFACPYEGRFFDRTSCQHYYECIQEGEGFRQTRRQCPDGSEWDMGGGCVRNRTTPCDPIEVSHCIIPEGYCPESLAPSSTPASLQDGATFGTAGPNRRFSADNRFFRVGNAPSVSSSSLWYTLNRGDRRT